ncbi:beta strand repeat-containing protein [Polynucleobacter yangtzensis]|uniref:beta strand repeat-containing protein n=1 Tax=Polynucleobacter yangtzensis TaxID=1743159 RepID=UPI00082FA62A|nr:autotransporter outer membrane beta-barrel domain-containing protein [Polynucleobacter yangtzensis]
MIKSAFIFFTFAVLIIFMASDLALAQSCAGGTIQNQSNSSTATLSDTANGQCLINSGTISPPSGGYGLYASFNNFSMQNLGSINLTGTDSSALTTNGYNSPLTTSGYIYNSGTIIASGAGNIYAIWPYNNTGTINSIVNSGSIQMNNTGQSVGIFVYSGNTVLELTNSGSITIVGYYSAIANGGTIAALNNSGSIVSTGNGQGIQNNASIGTINNTGTISATTSGFYGVSNSGTISTLNNSQGTSNTALTYTGALPSNYNIIISGASRYGKLAATSATGTTSFGIYSGSAPVKGTYSSVLSGITSGNLTGATSGNYNGFTWRLNNSSGSIWDLIVTGASTADTQQSLVNTASQLQNTYTLQNTVLANSFSYDCTEFGANGVCISAGGRNTAVSASNGLNNTSALLIAAYRPHPNYRIGAYADQNLSVNNAGSTVNLGNNTPLIGLFGAWNERLDGTGTEVKVSAAYVQKNTTVTRQVVGTSEAGSGSSNLNSQGAQVVAKYGFGVADNNVIVSPYVGIRYTQNNMGGYTENTSSAVTAPLTYSALNTNATTALAGIGAQYRFMPKATAFASAGVETDTNTNNGTYSATGIVGLTPINFNPNPVKTRPTAMLGASYDIEKNQRLGITGIYRQEAYQATATTTVMATYTVGL